MEEAKVNFNELRSPWGEGGALENRAAFPKLCSVEQ